MKPPVRIAVGFTVFCVLCTWATMASHYSDSRREWTEPLVVLVGVPALLFLAGLGLAMVIRGGKDL